MKRMRRRSLTKTRKWSTCRADAGGPQATARAWAVTTGKRQSKSSWTCPRLGIGCARTAPVSLSFQRPYPSHAREGHLQTQRLP